MTTDGVERPNRFLDGAFTQSVPLEALHQRGSCRQYQATRLDRTVLEELAAAALASPTKSDLQQRDILFVEDPALRSWINALFPSMSWIETAPHFVVFLANNRRQRLMHDLHGIAFENDHLDAFFNATVDAAVALSAFVLAAERLGYGTCPISVLRDFSAEVSERLSLPDHVFPICGLTLGRPVTPPKISPRLDLATTVHWDSYQEQDLIDKVHTYDDHRNQVAPYSRQRNPEKFGESASYGWSLDKVRQYNDPQRTDFGAFIRAKGFNLS